MNTRKEEQIRKYKKGREKQLLTQQLRKAKKKNRGSSPRERVRQKNWTNYALDDWGELECQTEERIMPLRENERRKEVHQLAQSSVTLQTSLVESDHHVIENENLYRGLVLEAIRGIAKVQLREETIVCSLRGSIKDRHSDFSNPLVAGDQVMISRVSEGEGVVEDVLPRRGVLARSNMTQIGADMSQHQLIAANVDQVLIVTSWRQPNIWPELIDRYLITTLRNDLEAVLCVNKADLIGDDTQFASIIQPYLDIGLRVILTSTVTGEGIEDLRAVLLDKTSVLAGLSGVGKSSLLSAIQPGLNLKARSVKVAGKNKNQGRHTTSIATLWSLDDGGAVIDTPGIRSFGLGHLPVEELAFFFPEMTPYVGYCKFKDCRHDNEPGCAIRKAVVTGGINPLRYKTYMRLVEELQ